MAIDFAYVLDEDKKNKEIRAIKYLLAGDKEQKKILIRDKDVFKKYYPDLDSRLDVLSFKISTMENILTRKYGIRNLSLPTIYDRAKEVGGEALNYYNHIYAYYSNVEHHNYMFGQAYVDIAKCEPLEKPEAIDKSSYFRPELILIMFRSLFHIILQGFNIEFRLKWKDKLDDLLKIHNKEYAAINEIDKKEEKR
jgi:hypothetical protein